MAEKNRIAWVDCAKGITIILVIVAHAVSSTPLVYNPIYSFHMPLFVILSGYTTTCASDVEKLAQRLKKSFCRLFVPAYALYFMGEILGGLTGLPTRTLREDLYNCFWVTTPEPFIRNGAMVQGMGIPWFLVILFLARNLYDALHLLTKGRHMTALSVVLAVLAALVGQRTHIPFGIDVAMISLVFYDFGQHLKDCSLQPTAPRSIGICTIWGGVPTGGAYLYKHIF